MYLDRLGISFVKQGKHLAPEPLNRSNPPIETLTYNHRELALNHVQPTCTFWRVVKLEALCKRKCFVGWQILIERTRVMGIEVVEYKSNLGCMLVRSSKMLTKLCEFALGTPLVHLANAPSRPWFYGRKQGTRTKLFIFVMLFGDFALSHWPWHQCVANQETRSFVEADNWISGIIWEDIERENVFKPCEKGCINLANAPGLSAVRL